MLEMDDFKFGVIVGAVSMFIGSVLGEIIFTWL